MEKTVAEAELREALNVAVAAWAKHAGEEMFEERFGAYFDKSINLIVIFNNNPYAQAPGLREVQMDDLLGWLAERGTPAVATAIHPPAGEPDAGYTVAALVAGALDDVDPIRERMNALTMKAMDVMRLAKGSGPQGQA